MADIMSPRHGPLPPKSFAQHLLEIEREAARAARRVRGANARASLSFADPPLSAAGGARQAAGGQSTVADARLAEAEEVRCRAACDALVLRRALPEVESQLNSCAALLHASVRREQHASQRAGQLSQALSASQAAETRLAAEVQQLHLANVALTHRVAELERNAPVSGGPATGASRLPAPPAGLVARGAGRGAAPQSGWAAQHAARPASAAAPVCAPSDRAAAVVSTPHTREKTACGARPVAERGGVIPEQAEIVQAAVALATLEAALVPGAQPYEAGLAAAAAAGAQMAATPPSDNDQRAAWVGYAQAVHWSPASSAEVTEALAAAPAWVAAVLAAADSFVGGSMAQLDGHVRGVLRDGTAAAVRELQARAAADGGAGVGRAAAAEAAARVMAALRASVGALQQQLADGLVRSLGTEPAAAACPVQLLGKLCARAVAASCEPLTRLTSHADLSAHILEEVGVYGAVAAALSRAGGPEEWLRDFILGREAAPMAEETSGFIATQVARHLDPYLDGERTPLDAPPAFLPALRAAYAALHAGRSLPAPPELVLALYLRHAIAKSNSLHCFGELVMGEGRLPVMQPELEAHLTALAAAVVEAIGRDFGGCGGIPVEAGLIEAAAREHAHELYMQQQQLNDRLAEANAAGEEGRRQEMRHIFGIEV